MLLQFHLPMPFFLLVFGKNVTLIMRIYIANDEAHQ